MWRRTAGLQSQQGPCIQSAESASVVALAMVLACVALTPLACWGGTDANEPNNDLQQATKLTSGQAVAGTIGLIAQPGDLDIFSSEAPQSGGANRFLVEVRCARPDHLNVLVGGELPGPRRDQLAGVDTSHREGRHPARYCPCERDSAGSGSGSRAPATLLTVTWQRVSRRPSRHETALRRRSEHARLSRRPDLVSLFDS